MTDEQKDGNWRGLYTDDELTSWQWTCAAPVIDDIRTPEEVKD